MTLAERLQKFQNWVLKLLLDKRIASGQVYKEDSKGNGYGSPEGCL